MGSSLAKAKGRRATSARWDEQSNGNGEDDSDFEDDAQSQWENAPAPSFFSEVKPLATWVLVPDVWRGQLIDVFDDSDETQRAEEGTPRV
jgi:hypothetical protein